MPEAGQEVDLTSEPESEGGLIFPEVLEVGEVERVGAAGQTADQVDLTAEPPPAEGLSTPEAIALDREKLRGRLAVLTLALLSGLLAAAFIGLITKRVTGADTKDFLAVTLPAVTALTGGAVAFYFGSERSAGR